MWPQGYHRCGHPGGRAGKTIGSYIRERRITEAGSDIKKGEKVLDVALKYGYES